MGRLERQASERMRNSRLQRAVLAAAESFSNFTTEALAGSVYKMYKLMDHRVQQRKYRSILAARDRLVVHGLLKRECKFLSLTVKGKKKLCEWQHRDYCLPRPKKWDGKWRVLIFDIPEKRRRLRNKVRNTLRAVGFKQLQQSVWIYPFDCEDFITLLKADFKIGKDLLYLIAEAVEYDRHLRDYFEVYPS
ncbi:MAG: Transcriptional regulator, PaaX family [Parcubacteria group bacterium GW2011_GWA2_47_16]|nr:MAG: Transcriptional regulator, PaaX family [Parcubacteria group bacterium GW2011_GWA2_47_16]